MKFTKPALPISAQIAKLKTRGLSVTDDKDAEHCLRYIMKNTESQPCRHRGW